MRFQRALIAGAVLATVTACGSTPAHDMAGMSSMPGSDYTITPKSTVDSGKYVFQIVDGSGKALTSFQPDQTKLMHFYLIRSDLSGFQHVHPEMAADGTWTAQLAPTSPGDYRIYTTFTSNNKDQVLNLATKVPGTATTTALPPASDTTQVDGYTVALSGEPMAGMAHSLKVTISKDGRPVTDLQPYLGVSAHLSAFHEGDLAFAHLHPEGNGPDLSFHAMLPKSGNYRLFVQFQTAGVLHTAAITMAVK